MIAQLTWVWPETPVSLLIIVVIAVVVQWVLRRAIRLAVTASIGKATTKNSGLGRHAERILTAATGYNLARHEARTRTLGSVLRSIVTVVVWGVALLMSMSVLGLPLAPLLTSAGIGGVALGFGAQSLVKDYLSGIFMIMEDQYGVGDLINTGDVTGTVEDVGLRVTRLRDAGGQVWYVRNGEILRIGNMSMGWSRVIIDLAVPADAPVEEVEEAMLAAARSLPEEAKWRSRILEQPEIWGLESVSGDALVIRLVMKTRAGAKDDVARELRMRLKNAIDELGLTLPQLNSIMLSGLEGAQRVRGANPPKTRPTPLPEGADRVVWKPKKRGRKRSKAHPAAPHTGAVHLPPPPPVDPARGASPSVPGSAASARPARSTPSTPVTPPARPAQSPVDGAEDEDS